MATNNKLSAYILLDRSGSMAGARWENAIGSINQYVKSLKEEKVSAEVTVATFDSNYVYPARPMYVGVSIQMNADALNPKEVVDPNSFDIIRDKVSLAKFKDLSPTETSPRGGTPLYDSTAKLINLAEAVGNEKTVIIIMTDGEENSSVNYTLQAIRDRIVTCKARNWEVLFLGAEFNADNIATQYGLSKGKVINTTLKNTSRSMDFYAKASASYADFGTAVDTMAVKADLAN